eukprot:GHVL01008938.1.p1 GENE.GHVL01008938.1~~GHVL01008938.1.p1  ORF type:complete len:564 (+),score=96.34 GHVL01008938.1:161-1852(+)
MTGKTDDNLVPVKSLRLVDGQKTVDLIDVESVHRSLEEEYIEIMWPHALKSEVVQCVKCFRLVESSEKHLCAGMHSKDILRFRSLVSLIKTDTGPQGAEIVEVKSRALKLDIMFFLSCCIAEKRPVVGTARSSFLTDPSEFRVFVAICPRNTMLGMYTCDKLFLPTGYNVMSCLGVIPSARRQGIGPMLYRFALALVKLEEGPEVGCVERSWTSSTTNMVLNEVIRMLAEAHNRGLKLEADNLNFVCDLQSAVLDCLPQLRPISPLDILTALLFGRVQSRWLPQSMRSVTIHQLPEKYQAPPSVKPTGGKRKGPSPTCDDSTERSTIVAKKKRSKRDTPESDGSGSSDLKQNSNLRRSTRARRPVYSYTATKGSSSSEGSDIDPVVLADSIESNRTPNGYLPARGFMHSAPLEPSPSTRDDVSVPYGLLQDYNICFVDFNESWLALLDPVYRYTTSILHSSVSAQMAYNRRCSKLLYLRFSDVGKMLVLSTIETVAAAMQKERMMIEEAALTDAATTITSKGSVSRISSSKTSVKNLPKSVMSSKNNKLKSGRAKTVVKGGVG